MWSVLPLPYAEIDQIADITPLDWKVDIPAVFRAHWGTSYFHALGIMDADKLIGVGNVIINGTVAWLGHIIVRDTHRNQGIGAFLTQALVQYGQSCGCNSILLVATELGQPVYEKIGFQAIERYIFLRAATPLLEAPPNSHISPLTSMDWEQVVALDREAAGEDRTLLLSKYFEGGIGWCHEGQALEGFWLPSFGDGLIVAKTIRAGIGLLQHKHARPFATTSAVLPESNKAAIAWLISNGFEPARVAPRMYLGTPLQWRPEMIFSRISGYLG